MNRFEEVSGCWVVQETQRLFGLKIAEGASLAAPPGKLLTMTMNGIQMEPLPGTYEGDIVLTVTESIPVGTMARSELKTAVYIGAEGPESARSVSAAVLRGRVEAEQATGLTVSSQGDCFSGLIYDSPRDYTVEDLDLDFIGNGNNESVGEGAGVIALGSGTLTLNRARIQIRGAARSAIFDGGNSRIVVNDSTISTRGGVLPPDYEDSIAAGRMKRVPWMLGLRGNSRATNVAERSTAVYNRCTLTAAEWGVMSTDGVEQCRLELNDCRVAITGKSGYGAFSLLDTVVTLKGTTVQVPDYGLIVANGPASGRITGASAIHAGRFGVMCFRNSGTVTVEDGSLLETGEACFVLKGCKTHIRADGCDLKPQNGVLLQLMDTDDPRNPKKYYADAPGPDVLNPARNLTAREAVAELSNLTAAGDIFNSTTNLSTILDRSWETPMGRPRPARKCPARSPMSGTRSRRRT